MGKVIPDAIIDVQLEACEGDRIAVLSAQPATYYEAIDPDQWAATTAYSLGDVVRPTTRNGFVYECTTAGTSDGSEPTWPTTPGNTVADNTVVWTCRDNYCLSQATLGGGDFTKANGDSSGRKNTVAAKSGASIHTTGTASDVAILDTTAMELRRNTTCSSQALTSGGTVDIGAHDHEIGDVT